jgi:hypothetical protein
VEDFPFYDKVILIENKIPIKGEIFFKKNGGRKNITE